MSSTSCPAGPRASSAQGRQRLVDVGPHPLAQRPLGPGLAALLRRRQPAVGEQPQHLRLDRDLREPLPDQRIRRPLQLVRQLAQRHLHPRLQRERQPGALVHQRRDRHAPAVVHAADDVLDRNPRLFDEQLVELGLAGDLDQRPDLDALLLHVHQEVGEPAVLGRVRVRAREQHAPLGVMGERRPHLLAGHDVRVAVQHRARLQRRQVRARLRLAEPLAPDLVGATGSATGIAPSARPSRAR